MTTLRKRAIAIGLAALLLAIIPTGIVQWLADSPALSAATFVGSFLFIVLRADQPV